MTTTRAIIANTTSSTLSTIYTNSTGNDALLKALNITGSGDPSIVNMTPTGDTWTYIGSSVNPILATAASSGSGFGVPIIIKISADRIMLIWLPNFTHQGGLNDYMGGGLIHTQILEYQTDRYMAGPIVNVLLPAQLFNAATYSLRSVPSGMSGLTYGQTCLKGIALSTTKVAIAIRQGSSFFLMRLPIVGNAVDVPNVANLSLTGASNFNTTTSAGFDIDNVPGNANKVLVGGYGTSNYLVQAYNIPDTGAITNATSAINTGITSAIQPFAMGLLNKTATSNTNYYAAVGGSSATAGSIILISYNSSTDVLATVGAAASISGSTQWSGFEVHSVSTGTNVNGVVAAMSTGVTNAITFYQQTSSTAASSTSTSLTLQSSVARALHASHNWGDERAIFTGDSMCVCFDSAGVSTNLLPTTLTSSAVRYHALFFPFDSRPLQNFYDPATVRVDNVTQYIGRVGMTSTTDVGEFEYTSNYLPWGHDYGAGFAWSAAANCWFAAQGGRIYALSATGKVLDEVSLYNFSTTFNYIYQCKHLCVTPSGKLILIIDYAQGSIAGSNYDNHNTWNNYSATLYGCSTLPITSQYGLSKTALASPTTSFTSGFMVTSLVPFVDFAGTERAILIYLGVVATPATYYALWNDNTWTNTGTAISGPGTTTTGSWNVGYRPQLKVIQDTPASQAWPQGRWRLLGYNGTNSQANMYTMYLYAAVTPGNFGSWSQETAIGTLTHGYGISYNVGENFEVAAFQDPGAGWNRVKIFASSRGRLTFGGRGWWPVANVPNCNYVTVATSKFNYSVAAHNSSGANNIGRVYVFTDASIANPVATITAANGYGSWVHTTTNRLSVSAYNANATANISNTYTTHGSPDNLKFYATIGTNSNTFYINNGQSLASNGFFRSSDTYVIPNGYSLKISAEVANNFSAMATIIEEV